MAKAKQSLEEGLDRSANKKGFKGKKRQQYIGGAIRNMEKRGEFTIKRKPAAPRQRGLFDKKPAPKPPKPKPPRKPPKPKPEPVRRETPVRVPKDKIKLIAKKNEAASLRYGYNVYSVYYAGKGGKQFSSSTHRSPDAAKKEALLAMDAHNHPKGVHTQSSFGARQRQYLT